VYKGVKKAVTGVYNTGKGLVRGVGRVIDKAFKFLGLGRKENNPRPSQGRRSRRQQRPQYHRRR